MKNKRPLIISSGDPAGIGLELVQKAWEVLRGKVLFAVMADQNHVQGPVTEIKNLNKLTGNEAHLPVLHHSFTSPAILGDPSLNNSQNIVDVIKKCVNLVLNGEASALCTLPINKNNLRKGCNFLYSGHTDFLEAITKAKKAVMMLSCSELRVVPVTVHIGLSKIVPELTKELIIKTIRVTERSLINNFSLPSPRIFVAGLNPHAGEAGMMGTEEINIISPAIQTLFNEGMNVTGPYSPDSMFHAKARLKYDVAICMYHDQALIPLKTIDFSKSVNITLGLPIIRTSPDHGTAYDIAGKGIADPSSLIQAIMTANQMSQNI